MLLLRASRARMILSFFLPCHVPAHAPLAGSRYTPLQATWLLRALARPDPPPSSALHPPRRVRSPIRTARIGWLTTHAHFSLSRARRMSAHGPLSDRRSSPRRSDARTPLHVVRSRSRTRLLLLDHGPSPPPALARCREGARKVPPQKYGARTAAVAAAAAAAGAGAGGLSFRSRRWAVVVSGSVGLWRCAEPG